MATTHADYIETHFDVELEVSDVAPYMSTDDQRRKKQHQTINRDGPHHSRRVHGQPSERKYTHSAVE